MFANKYQLDSYHIFCAVEVTVFAGCKKMVLITLLFHYYPGCSLMYHSNLLRTREMYKRVYRGAAIFITEQ